MKFLTTILVVILLLTANKALSQNDFEDSLRFRDYKLMSQDLEQELPNLRLPPLDSVSKLSSKELNELVRKTNKSLAVLIKGRETTEILQKKLLELKRCPSCAESKKEEITKAQTEISKLIEYQDQAIRLTTYYLSKITTIQ